MKSILAVRAHMKNADDISKRELVNFVARIVNDTLTHSKTEDAFMVTLRQSISKLGEYNIHLEDTSGDITSLEISDAILVVSDHTHTVH